MSGCGTADFWEALERYGAEVRRVTAEHLDRTRADAWDEGHRFTGYEPEPGENPYRGQASRNSSTEAS